MSMPTHDFPSEPATDDTRHLYHAIAEHNWKRVAAGLHSQNYFQLSSQDRSEVFRRAQELKDEAALARIVEGSDARMPPPCDELRGFYLWLVGAAGAAVVVVVLSLHYL